MAGLSSGASLWLDEEGQDSATICEVQIPCVTAPFLREMGDAPKDMRHTNKLGFICNVTSYKGGISL